MQLGGAGHGVGAVHAELAFQFVGCKVRRAEIGVRIASGGGPGGTAEFSVEAHLSAFVLKLYRFYAGRWHVTDKSTLPSRIVFEFLLCPQTLKRTVLAVVPSFTRSLLVMQVTLAVLVTYLSTACTRNTPTIPMCCWKRLLTSNDGTRRRALFRLILLRWRRCGRDLVAHIGEELCGVDEVILGVTAGLHEDSLFAGMGHRVLGEVVFTVEGLVPVAGVVAGRLHEIRTSELRRGALFRRQRSSLCFKSLDIEVVLFFKVVGLSELGHEEGPRIIQEHLEKASCKLGVRCFIRWR